LYHTFRHLIVKVGAVIFPRRRVCSISDILSRNHIVAVANCHVTHFVQNPPHTLPIRATLEENLGHPV
jgi:hypothetical protein